jgi:hypothetical protein
LQAHRSSISEAVDANWQAECIKALEDVTGLKVGPMTQFEFSLRAVDGGPDFSFPTRELWQEAEKLSSPLNVGIRPEEALVDYYMRHLPWRTLVGNLELPPQIDLDCLGKYFSESGVVGSRIELYWAGLCSLSLTSKLIQPEAYAKVVMLHELAHFITHQGAEENGRHWESFPSGSDIVEIVAQVATEDVIRTKYSTLLPAFEALLEGAPLKYRDHRRIVKKLREEFSSSKINSAYAEFWYFFRNIIKSPKAPEITSIASLDVGIDWTKALTGGEHGMDLTF